MKNKDLIWKLSQFNPEADVSVIVHSQMEDFSITWGGIMDGEGTPKDKIHNVNFYVDRLCESEKENK